MRHAGIDPLDLTVNFWAGTVRLHRKREVKRRWQ
jgi:hypothetical protein